MNANKKVSGAALAVAAASFMGAASMATISAPAIAADNVKCHGVNSCKGHNDCAGEGNSCKGMGSSKGQGFLIMSAEKCAEKGGEAK